MRAGTSIIASLVISFQAYAMDNNALSNQPDKVVDIPLVSLTVSKHHPNRRTIFCPECKECPLQKMVQIKKQNPPFQGSWCANCDVLAYEKAKHDYKALYKEGKSQCAYVSTDFEKTIQTHQTRASRASELKKCTTLTNASEYDAQNIVSQDQSVSVGTDTSKIVFHTADQLERKRKAREAAQAKEAKKLKEAYLKKEKLYTVLVMHFGFHARDKGVTS